MSDQQLDDQAYIGTELDLFAYAENWKQYWSNQLKPLIGQHVLEIGAGVGSNLSLLKDEQIEWLAIEPDADQSDRIRLLTSGDDAVTVITGTLDSVSIDKKFDSIIYIDVLEHIEDDKEEIEKALNYLNKDGRLIILSPAHQSLFSPFDSAVGHFRRYNKRSLSSLIKDNSLIEQLYYLDSVGYIASWLNAKILKSGMPTKGQIWLWDSIMVRLSVFVDRIFNYSFGKTIIMVLKKP